MNGDGNWIKIEVEQKLKWKLHKMKRGSSLKKPLYVNDLFGNKIKKGNWIEKEIELKLKLNKNKNENCIKLKMKVHSRNHYTVTIY